MEKFRCKIFPWMSPRIQKDSLQNRIIFWTLISTFVMVLLIVLAIGFFISQKEEANLKAREQTIARNAADYFGLLIEHSGEQLSVLAGTREAYLEANPQFIDTLLTENPDLLELLAVSKTGKVIASAARDKSQLADIPEVAHEYWVRGILAGEHIVEIYRDSTGSTPELLIAVPAYSGGLVAARMKMDAFEKGISGFRVDPGERAYVLDPIGQVIAPGGLEMSTNGPTLKDHPEFRSIQAAENRTWVGLYKNFAGEMVIGASAPVRGTDWTAVTELPQNTAFANLRVMLLVLATSAMVIIVINVLFFMRQMRRLVFQPLALLQQGVEQISNGHFNSSINLRRRDEIGQVTAAFDVMTERLAKRQDDFTKQAFKLEAEVTERKRVAAELEALNLDLEARVRERTDELRLQISQREQVAQELRSSLERITLFNRVISAGSTVFEPDRVLQILCVELAHALKVPQAAFSLMDRESRAATVIAETGSEADKSVMGVASPVRGNAQAEFMVANRRPLYLANLRNNQRFCPMKEVIQRLSLQSALIVPLILREKVLGLLLLGSYVNRDFTPDEVALIQTVTTAAGQIFENARLYSEVQRELSERREIEGRLLYQSTHDSLTNLHNRMYFEDELQKLEWGHSRPVSLIMLDMDEMKNINDNYGHATGDEYLRRTSDILRRVFRSEDVVARLGGDEFAVILHPADAEDVLVVVNRLRAAITTHGGGLPAGPLHMSIGFATAQPGVSVVETLKLADHAMYEEKIRKRA